jgi:hypothetical protein
MTHKDESRLDDNMLELAKYSFVSETWSFKNGATSYHTKTKIIYFIQRGNDWSVRFQREIAVQWSFCAKDDFQQTSKFMASRFLTQEYKEKIVMQYRAV